MKITAFVLCLLAAGCAPAFTQSQLGTGAIAGTVQDSSGASVGGANVTVTNTETGMIRRVDSRAPFCRPAAATSNTTPLATPIQLTPTAGYLAPNNDATPPDGTNARRLQLAIRFRF